MAKKGPKNPLSDEHKAAMAAGRVEGRVVREYLDALRSTKPKRGRKRTAETINARLSTITKELETASPLDELRLLQERRDLTTELASLGGGIDIAELEAEFVKIAKTYSERQGIAYATWRDVGVQASVLKAAGISRAN
ncbi:MAG: hypothetical protein ACOYL9_06895 [Ilumatobacteraceae bacterium]|jgi:hypothetical protein